MPSTNRPNTAPDGSARPLPERIAELDAERQALELRTSAHTMRQIAEIQGCSVSTAYTRVQRGFRRLAPIEEAETLRARENDLLDTRERILLEQLAEHNAGTTRLSVNELSTLDGALARIAERRARLNGLDLPVTQKIEMVSAFEQEIEQLTRELTEQENTS